MMTDHLPVDRHYLWKIHEKLGDRIPMWVVYNPNTREYPGFWVARMHLVRPEPRPTRFVMTHNSLEEIRGVLPPGLTRLARDPLDVPEIEEIWL